MTDTLAAVASLGLPGATVPFPATYLDDEAWRSLLSGIRQHRISGLAARAAASGRLPASEAQLAELAGLDARDQSHCLRLEAALLGLGGALRAADVPFLVLKGPAVAHAVELDPSLRVFVDLDVLVPGDRLAGAVAACSALGAQRPVPELRPGFDRRFAKSVTMRTGDGLEWDLHRTLVLGPHTFLVDVGDLWQAPGRFQLAGQTMAMPSLDVCFLQACLHATITGSTRLQTLRDIALLAERVDRERVADTAERWRCRPAVREAIHLMIAGLAVDRPDLLDWANRLPAPRDEERLLAGYAPGVRTARSLALAGWAHVPGLWGKAAYAWAVAMPSDANRRARGRTRLAQARRLAGR